MKRLSQAFFIRDVLEVAPELLGKNLVRVFPDGIIHHYRITELEAYRGEEDKACHARNGKTDRNRVMYENGGKIYIYLIYGMYWMLNITTGPEGFPQAILIRGIDQADGPGKLTRKLHLDKGFYGENLATSSRLWLEDTGDKQNYCSTPRIGVDYAGEYWKNIAWRYVIEP